LNQFEGARIVAQKWYAVIVGIVALVLAFALYEQGYVLTQAYFIGIFFLLIALGNSLYGLLLHPSSIMLGEISYSIYLLHGAIIYVVFNILFPNYLNSSTTLAELFIGMALTGILIIITSWLTYRLIEKPFINLGRKIISQKP
jgi:peptidoglycan/LPS O-acetylase OafA/YrhL